MRETFKKILEAIEHNDTIVIFRHKRPDPDAIGSQGGLQHILKATYPQKDIYVVGDEVESLQFLNRMDKVEDELFQNALAIVVDTATEDRISDNRFKLAKQVIKIDHHPNDEPYGDLVWVDTSYASASEMVTELFGASKLISGASHHTENKGLIMSGEAAKLLYAGVVGDTGRFLYNNTSSRTHHIASILMSYDFAATDIFEEMYKTKENVARLNGFILQHYKKTMNGVAYFKVTKEVILTFDTDTSEAANLVNTLSGIIGNQVWVFFIEEDEEIRVRIRSKRIAIDGFAKRYSGGGHKLASGASVKSWEEANLFLSQLDELVKNYH